MMHTRTRRILLTVLAAVILLPVLAILALVATFDGDSAKPRIIAAVLAATGRILVIDGPVRLVPGLHPSIEINDAALSNPPGFSRPQMAVLQQLNLKLALLPLLHRQIEIDSLVVSRADILLELNAEGIGNWRFQPRTEPAAGLDPSPRVATKPRPFAIHIDKIELADGQIAYRNPKMAAPVALAIGALILTSGAADGYIGITMAASSDAVPFTLDGKFGPYSVLFAEAGQSVNLDLSLAASGAKVSLAGLIADPARLAGADIRIKADVPDLAALSGLVRTALPPLKGIAAQARLTDLPGKPGLLFGVALHDLKIALPQAQIDGDIALSRGSPPLFQGTLHATRIDADALSAAKPAATSPQSASPVAAGTLQPAPPQNLSPKRLIPDGDLPLAFLHEADADLTLSINELIEGGIAYRDIAGQIALHNGALRIAPFAATTSGGPVKFTLAVDAAQAAPPVALTLSAPAFALAPFLAALVLPPYGQGNLWVDADFKATGRSPHQLAATLDGSIGLAMENAQIDSRLLGDAWKSLDLLKNGKPGLTAISCLAVRMDAHNGVGTLRALLLDTAPARLSGSGSLNLGEETLDLRLQTTIRMGSTGIAAPLDIRGTFLAPKVKVDTAMPAGGALPNAPFGIVIGRLGGDRPVTGETCSHDLAIARGETPPPETIPPPSATPGVKPPKPADLLRQLLR